MKRMLGEKRWVVEKTVNGDGGEGGVRSWSDRPGQGKQNAVHCKIQGKTQKPTKMQQSVKYNTKNALKCSIQDKVQKYKSKPQSVNYDRGAGQHY